MQTMFINYVLLVFQIVSKIRRCDYLVMKFSKKFGFKGTGNDSDLEYHKRVIVFNKTKLICKQNLLIMLGWCFKYARK